MIHRDIKPENILLHDGRALVADFGIALAASKASGSRMTETGMSLGTPHYMSPEQAMGEREITARSDVYALGAMLYEMLTGDPPFTGSTAQAIVARVLTEAPRPMLPQRHTIPPHVEAAVLTALEKLPADRFGTRGGVRGGAGGAELRADRPHGGGRAGRARRPRPARRRDPVTLALLGVAAVATAAALWGWLRPAPDADGQPVQPLPAAGAGAPAGDAVGEPGRDLAGREAAGVRGPGGARRAGSGSGSTTSSARRRSRGPRARGRRSSRPTAATSGS